MITTATVMFPKVEDLQAAVTVALEEAGNYNDGGYYTEYVAEDNYGRDGNSAIGGSLGNVVHWNPETNQFMIEVNVRYGHGSKYNPTDWIEDDESCCVLVTPTGNPTFPFSGEIVDNLENDGFITLDDESAEFDAAMDGVDTDIEYDC